MKNLHRDIRFNISQNLKPIRDQVWDIGYKKVTTDVFFANVSLFGNRNREIKYCLKHFIIK
jgi:hypothetical protein